RGPRGPLSKIVGPGLPRPRRPPRLAGGPPLPRPWPRGGRRGPPKPDRAPADAEALLQASPDANIATDLARTHLDRVIGDLGTLQSELARMATERAAD